MLAHLLKNPLQNRQAGIANLDPNNRVVWEESYDRNYLVLLFKYPCGAKRKRASICAIRELLSLARNCGVSLSSENGSPWY
jgi:hypothetical protein